jgi:hypothetical protein
VHGSARAWEIELARRADEHYEVEQEALRLRAEKLAEEPLLQVEPRPVWDSNAEEAERHRREEAKTERRTMKRLAQSKLAKRMKRDDKGRFTKHQD